MAYHFDFDAAHRILRSRFEGRVTDEEIKHHYGITARYIVQTDPLGGILDMTAVTAFEVSSTTIRELANTQPAFSDPQLPRVLIAPAPSIFGLARMFEVEGGNRRPNLHVVRSESEALVIFGIERAHFTPIALR